MRFALKTLERLRIVFKFRREKFQRDGAVQFRVFGLVDDADASPPSLSSTRKCRIVLPDKGSSVGM